MNETNLIKLEEHIILDTTVRPYKDEGGEPWIPGVEVAKGLGYEFPKEALGNLLKRNPEDFDGCYLSSQIDYSGQSRKIILLNENGVYMMAMLAQTEKARWFRRSIIELIKSIKRGEFIHKSQFEKLIEEKTAIVRKELEMYQNEMDDKFRLVSHRCIEQKKDLLFRGSDDLFYESQWIWRLKKHFKLFKKVAEIADFSPGTVSKKYWKYQHYLDATGWYRIHVKSAAYDESKFKEFKKFYIDEFTEEKFDKLILENHPAFHIVDYYAGKYEEKHRDLPEVYHE